MKRIVYTVTSLSNAGGTERVLVNKANWLVNSGYDISIITESSTKSFYQVDPRIKIYALDISKPSSDYIIIRFINLIIFFVTYGVKISRLLRKINPDIVISINARDFSILPFVNRKSKKIYEFHFIVSQLKAKESMLVKIVSKIMNIIGNCYDYIVLLTQKDKEHNGNKWDNVIVIPNARTFFCNTPAKLENNRAIAVGNLFNIKGFGRLIDVWSIVHQRHPDWKLSIYGEGHLRDELQSKINELSLSDVIKLEGQTVDIKNAYLRSSLSLISSYEESFSMTLLEAQTCGLPAIAFDCPFGPSGIITDGVDGFLISEGDIQAFANKICLLIENETLRKEMGYNAVNNSARFAEDKVMAQWIALFEE